MITCLGIAPAWDVTYGVDGLRVGSIHRPTWVHAQAGGKATNVARALRRLGEHAALITPLGGTTGERMRRGLEEERIPLLPVTTASETRTCVSVVDERGTTTTEFYETAPPLASDEASALADAVDRIDRGWIAVSGAVPELSIALLTPSLQRARERGLSIAFDVHGRALTEWLQLEPDLVKVNRDEAAAAVGEADPAELALRLLACGAHAAVVTDGARGARAAEHGALWSVEPAPGGRFTVGSGDTFLAGLLSGIRRGSPWTESLALASGAAAANTLEPGAGVFSDQRAGELAGAVRVRPAHPAE